MNITCGVDIIEVARIKKLIESSPAFARRVFTDKEVEYCNSKKNKWQHYAVRFAAKEAIWKAVGCSGLGLRDIGIKNDTDGKPRPELKANFRRYEKNIDVSLSHTKEYAVAFAVRKK